MRRGAILNAARKAFFAFGYGGASMSMISHQLGRSKGTLYNHFKNKNELFEAQIVDCCRSFGDEIFFERPENKALEIALVALAEHYINYLMDEDNIRTLRLVVAECQQRPELARVFNEFGSANVRRQLAEKLLIAETRGLIETPDLAAAARHFFGLCRGGIYFDRLLNIIPKPDQRAIRMDAENVSYTFMRAYTPQIHAEFE